MSSPTRLFSVITSMEHYGFLTTFRRLTQIALVKSGFKDFISEKGIGPIYLRNRTSDIPVFRQIFLNGEYDFSVPIQPKVIFDLGANIGMFTMLMRQRYPEALIIAVEPDPENFRQLQKNIAGSKKVHAIKAAVWSHITQLQLESNPLVGEWGRSVAEIKSGERVTHLVETVTMESLMQDFNVDSIDILKIDIEGAEKELFAGDAFWLNAVNYLLIELHDYMGTATSKPFIQRLSGLNNFRIWQMGENMMVEIGDPK